MFKISVIVPVYNKEKYLRQCLDSIINQTLKEIEIICLDDNSTDSSLEILNEYAQKYSCFVIKELDKRNAAIMRNIAMEIAQGEFISFMDADDFYPSDDILETLYNKAKENNVLICGGEFAEFIEEEQALKSNYQNKFDGYVFEQDGIVEYKNYQFDYGFTRFIYNRQFIIDNNILFPNVSLYEDPPFMINAMLKAEKFYAVKKIIYAYRNLQKRNMLSDKKLSGLLSSLSEIFDIAKKYNYKKLSKYSVSRFKDFIKLIKLIAIFKHFSGIIKLIKLDYRILGVILYEFCYARIFKQIFSITNEENNKKLIILGLDFTIKRRKNG